MKYRLRFVLDGESFVALDAFEERSDYSVVVPLEGFAGSLLYANSGDDLGQLYYSSERLETTLLATNVATFR